MGNVCVLQHGAGHQCQALTGPLRSIHSLSFKDWMLIFFPPLCFPVVIFMVECNGNTFPLFSLISFLADLHIYAYSFN